jgi:hypothetical protein
MNPQRRPLPTIVGCDRSYEARNFGRSWCLPCGSGSSSSLGLGLLARLLSASELQTQHEEWVGWLRWSGAVHSATFIVSRAGPANLVWFTLGPSSKAQPNQFLIRTATGTALRGFWVWLFGNFDGSLHINLKKCVGPPCGHEDWDPRFACPFWVTRCAQHGRFGSRRHMSCCLPLNSL